MLKEIIENLKEKNLRPKEEINIKTILETINKAFTLNKDMLNQYFRFDIGAELDFDRIGKIFSPIKENQYGNIDSPFINSYGRVSKNMSSYGVVGIAVKEKIMIYNFLELFNICIQTRNSLIIEYNHKSKALELIVEIINDVLSLSVDFNNIILTSEQLENENSLDLLIYIGSKAEFNKLPFEKTKIYCGIGKYELYVDEILDERLIEEAKKQNIKILYSSETSMEEMNKLSSGYATAIMTSNKETVRRFISTIKSTYVLVNMLPTLISDINIYPEQLLKRKNIVIFE